MNRQPFITAELRPDLTIQTDLEKPTLDERATNEQLAQAATEALSEEERLQIERGIRGKHEQLMQAVPQPSPHVHGTTLDGETVLLDLNTGRYYTLNRVGTAIWELCTGAQSLQYIHSALCNRFEASAERIGDDLFALVTQLSHEGLVALERR